MELLQPARRAPRRRSVTPPSLDSAAQHRAAPARAGGGPGHRGPVDAAHAPSGRGRRAHLPLLGVDEHEPAQRHVPGRGQLMRRAASGVVGAPAASSSSSAGSGERPAARTPRRARRAAPRRTPRAPPGPQPRSCHGQTSVTPSTSVHVRVVAARRRHERGGRPTSAAQRRGRARCASAAAGVQWLARRRRSGSQPRPLRPVERGQRLVDPQVCGVRRRRDARTRCIVTRCGGDGSGHAAYAWSAASAAHHRRTARHQARRPHDHKRALRSERLRPDRPPQGRRTRAGRLLPGPGQRPARRSSPIYSTALGPALGGTRFYPYASRGRRPSTTCSSCRAAMAYKNAPAPASTSAAARPSSSATRAATRPSRCCGRTAGSSSRSAAATTPPATSAPTCRTWTSSPARRASSTGRSPERRRRRRQRGAHRVRRLPGDARRGRARLGRPDAARPAGRRRGRRQGRLTTWSSTCSRTARGVVVTDVSAAAVDARARGLRRSRSRRRRRRCRTRRHRRLRALRARRRAQRRAGAGAAGEDRLRRAPTTSSPTPASRRRWPTAAMLYAPDYVANAGGVIQVADEASARAASASSAPRPRPRGSSTRRCRSSRLADAEGVPPAVAADRLAERRMAEVGRLRRPAARARLARSGRTTGRSRGGPALRTSGARTRWCTYFDRRPSGRRRSCRRG